MRPSTLSLLSDHWYLRAREPQLSPWSPARGERMRAAAIRRFSTWFIRTGRGWGKTKSAAECVQEEATLQGESFQGALIGRTAADVRDTMIEGPSGLLNTHQADNRPTYYPSRDCVVWPNGAKALCYSDEVPDDIRGGNFTFVWGDEVASWKNLQESWDQVEFATRIGDPRFLITSTPKPRPLIKHLCDRSDTFLTLGSTFDNEKNLASRFIAKMKDTYMGSTLGRQELEGDLLGEVEGALWSRSWIDTRRVTAVPAKVRITRLVVGADPSTSSKEDACEAGIIVGGLGTDGLVYVFSDLSKVATVNQWGKTAVEAYKHHKAECIVLEANLAGELIESAIKSHDRLVRIKKVYAKTDKRTRAEPVSSLYELGKVVHVGTHKDLEDQMCEWVPGRGSSPDRIDALVWVVTELKLLGHGGLPVPDGDSLDREPLPWDYR